MDHDRHEGHDHPAPSGPLVVPIHHPVGGPGAEFTRADVVLTGVDHSGSSYEVRLFLNHPGADIDTPRDATSGYGGRFHVFGHGGCFGDAGHCDLPSASNDPTDLRPTHPLTPLSTYVTVTSALQRLVELGVDLESLAMVPLALPPLGADARPAPDLFRYETVELRTYLTPRDEPPA